MNITNQDKNPTKFIRGSVSWCGYCREEIDSTSESHSGTWNEYGTATCPQCGSVYSYAQKVF